MINEVFVQPMDYSRYPTTMMVFFVPTLTVVCVEVDILLTEPMQKLWSMLTTPLAPLPMSTASSMR